MIQKPPVVIVSGLPRSGTSLLMQMLQAGGAPLLVDEQRPADQWNPRGYFEYEPVKRLRSDPSWLGLAVGKGLKVVSPLLESLPPGFTYHVLLMHRRATEVAASQQALLAASNSRGAGISIPDLIALLTRQQARVDRWLQANPQFRVLRLEHGAVLTIPLAAAEKVAQFLHPVWPDLVQKCAPMAQAVQPELHRQREDA